VTGVERDNERREVWQAVRIGETNVLDTFNSPGMEKSKCKMQNDNVKSKKGVA
jgi:hypothetical protein